MKARFMEKVELPEEKDGCWNWIGAHDSVGYGQIRVNNKAVGTHRVSYELFKGLIPPGLVIRHSCIGNKGCVNPEHLSTGTHKENVQDKLKQGRANSWHGTRHFKTFQEQFQARLKVEVCGCHSMGMSKIVNRYATITIKGNAILASRALYNLSKGLDPITPLPDGMVMKHSCDNRWCVNPEHLSIGTYSENMKEREERGRGNNRPAKGQTHYLAKLNDDDVREIRILLASGISQPNIGKKFGVCRQTIGQIKTGKTWQHVK